MAKKPLAVVSNDWHISSSNTDVIEEVMSQKIALCSKLNINTVFVLGDIFQSRQSQPLKVLKCFENILDKFHDAGIKVHCIPGNHDKTNYDSADSFLDSYTHHPALELTRSGSILKLGGIKVRMIPFISDELFLKAFAKSKELHPVSKNEILMSHIAVTGSVNNDGTKVSGSISPSLFEDFSTVLLGHYHNFHKVSGEIYHLPSVIQKDFGENDNKGFTIIYDDCSFEIVTSDFKRYETVEIDLDKVTHKEFKEKLKEFNTESTNVRIKLVGSNEKIKSIKIDELKMSGFHVKTDQKDISDSIEQIENGKIVEHDSSSLLEEFIAFCEKEEYDNIEIGNNYLKKQLNGQ